MLRRPGVSYRTLHTLAGSGIPVAAEDVASQVEVSIKYQGYIDRQQVDVSRGLEHEQLPMPANIDYAAVRGLSVEVQQKLNAQRPETLGQAARMSGHHPRRNLTAPRAPEARTRDRWRLAAHAGDAVRMTARAAVAATGERPAPADLDGVALPASARKRLSAYVDLLAKWNRTYNLTAIRERPQMITHHLHDALAVLPFFPRQEHLRVLDIGTGGGIPGIPLAIARPDWTFVLLDASQKKATFVTQ